jgi:hypothetical protein
MTITNASKPLLEPQQIGDWREILKVIPVEIEVPAESHYDSARDIILPLLELMIEHGASVRRKVEGDLERSMQAFDFKASVETAKLTIRMLGDTEDLCAAIWGRLIEKFLRLHGRGSGNPDWKEFERHFYKWAWPSMADKVDEIIDRKTDELPDADD